MGAGHFTNKVVVVAGGTSGIGLPVAGSDFEETVVRKDLCQQSR